VAFVRHGSADGQEPVGSRSGSTGSPFGRPIQHLVSTGVFIAAWSTALLMLHWIGPAGPVLTAGGDILPYVQTRLPKRDPRPPALRAVYADRA